MNEVQTKALEQKYNEVKKCRERIEQCKGDLETLKTNSHVSTGLGNLCQYFRSLNNQALANAIHVAIVDQLEAAEKAFDAL